MSRDLLHALRSIARMPLLAAVVVVSLGAGIGVNTAVFSWVEAMVLKPLPGVADVASIYLLEPRAETGSYPGASWPEYVDLAPRLRAIHGVAAFRMVPFSMGDPGRVERVYGELVSGNYFAALGLQPSAGRFFRPDEAARPGGEPVVVISHDLWRTRFAGDPAIVGRSVRLNGQ